jgi:hypothetical protein
LSDDAASGSSPIRWIDGFGFIKLPTQLIFDV